MTGGRVGYVPPMLPTATRHSCGERVRWVYHPDGRTLLIDAEPKPDGKLVLVLEERGWTAEQRRGYRALDMRGAGAELYRYHRCEEK